MSKCAVHMMKMKMSAMGGIQSHNQREHKSRKNLDIDYTKSSSNFDTVTNENLNYQREIKYRISELNLKKAVRKDAVVYCSFIVSSDKDFFEKLGILKHIEKQSEEREAVAYGLEEPFPFEIMGEDYQNQCITEGAYEFFDSATNFFQERYGIENVINGTVHMDEATPHMHLGVIPVTADGRLCAKEIFTPLELKQLQTEFAEKVGAKFDLERGKEGSEVTHLDEISFKVKKQQEKLKSLDEKVWELSSQEISLKQNCKDLEKKAESLSKTVSDLKTDIYTLDTQKRTLERLLAQLQEFKENLEKVLQRLALKGKSALGDMQSFREELSRERAMDFIKKSGQTALFERFCNNPHKAFDIQKEQGNKKNRPEQER